MNDAFSDFVDDLAEDLRKYDRFRRRCNWMLAIMYVTTALGCLVAALVYA